MKLATTVLLFAIAGFAAGQEPEAAVREPRLRGVPALPFGVTGLDAPWLGVAWKDLDDATRAQVPDLPSGIGFVVRRVDAGSPSEKAGIKPNDLVWKLGEQLIVNREQLFTLLRLHKEGDEVKLGIYRSGKAMDVLVVLGHLPEAPIAMSPNSDPKGAQEVPMVVKMPDKTTRVETPEGKAILTRSGEVFEVKIVSHSGSVIFEGLLRDEQGALLVPESWQACMGALERRFSHEVNVNLPTRPSRPRTNVPPAEDAAK
jgi:hypothetical protein